MIFLTLFVWFETKGKNLTAFFSPTPPPPDHMRYIEAAFQVKTLWHCRIRNYETAEDILYGVKLSVYRHLADHHGFTTRTIKTFHSCKQLEVEGGDN